MRTVGPFPLGVTSRWNDDRVARKPNAPRVPIGPTLPLVRASVTCADCGTVFDPGPSGAPMRCEPCRVVHEFARPDQRRTREPVTCADCGVVFLPAQKGSIPKRCPTCRPIHKRDHRRGDERKRPVKGRARGPRTPLDKSSATCVDCGGAVDTTGHGRAPQRCTECKREHKRLQGAAYYAQVKAAGRSSWRKPMACLDCGVDLLPILGERRNTRCDPCREKHRKPYQKDSVKNREKHLRRFYRLTIADVDAKVAAQDGRCAICGDQPVPPARLHVDHSHADKRVRALLCGPCNRMIGMAREDRDILAAASEYLDVHQADTP